VRFAASLHCRFDSPTDAVQEHGTVWGRRQSRWLRTADGFVVCGFRVTLASYFDIAGGDALTAFGVGPRMPIAW
jgi:hypothetical protein